MKFSEFALAIYPSMDRERSKMFYVEVLAALET